MESSDEEDGRLVSIPLISAGVTRANPNGKRHARRRPKYREMVCEAIEKLQEPKGSSYRSITGFIKNKYHVESEFIIKRIISWLADKKVVSKKGGRVKLTGNSLFLHASKCVPPKGHAFKISKSKGGKKLKLKKAKKPKRKKNKRKKNKRKKNKRKKNKRKKNKRKKNRRKKNKRKKSKRKKKAKRSKKSKKSRKSKKGKRRR